MMIGMRIDCLCYCTMMNRCFVVLIVLSSADEMIGSDDSAESHMRETHIIVSVEMLSTGSALSLILATVISN